MGDDAGIVLVGEAAQEYVRLQWYEFYAAIGVIVLLAVFFIWLIREIEKGD